MDEPKSLDSLFKEKIFHLLSTIRTEALNPSILQRPKAEDEMI